MNPTANIYQPKSPDDARLTAEAICKAMSEMKTGAEVRWHPRFGIACTWSPYKGIALEGDYLVGLYEMGERVERVRCDILVAMQTHEARVA